VSDLDPARLPGRAAARAAFAGLNLPMNPETVRVTERPEVQQVSVLGYPAHAQALREQVRSRYGLLLPQTPRRISDDALAFIGVAPDSWLVTQQDWREPLAARLREQLRGLAAVSDQSDAQAVLQLSGQRVRDVLARLIPIDVHAQAFVVNQVAATAAAAHIAVTLWRLPDPAAGESAFEITVPRSLAGSFAHALLDACHE
jgi:methylglutamate dehydrogenase subunit D